MKNQFLPILLCAAVAGCGVNPETSAENSGDAPLNIVLILVDDLGYGDVAVYGNPYVRTPHMDALAARGALFTDAYAPSPVCSPSRAGILLGRNPARIGLTTAIGPAGIRWAADRRLREPPNPVRLPYEETTLAEALREVGYRTASIGKWHLGGEDSRPQDHGFDVNFAGNDIGSQRTMFGPDYGIRLGPVPEDEYLTDRIQAEAEAFIRENRDRPFFALVSHFAVHRPIGAKPETIAHYPEHAEGPWGLLPEYAAMIEDFDATVGQMVAFLREEGLEERTVLIVVSDNGAVRQWGSNGLLRGAKGLIYEGGIRVPKIVWFPGIRENRTLTDPVHGIDIFPTVFELAGLDIPEGLALDGISLAPLLRGEIDSLSERPLYFHYPHYNMHGARPGSAVRVGDFKLLHFYETDHDELYNLREDPSESINLAERSPELLARMKETLEALRRDTGSIAPIPNPDFSGMEPEPVLLRPFESTRTAPGADPDAP